MARSALGREINMSALASRNEKVRAVGNMRVNARGDLVDSNNNVITNANKRVEASYNETVETVGLAPTMANNNMHNPGLTIDPIEQAEELSPEEQELFDEGLLNDEDDEEIKK
jgi:hypothetical protein